MPNESSTDIYKDLRSLTRADDRIVSFLEDVALDGVWFWDIADRSRGWVSDQFWRTLGYDPQDPPPFDWAALIDAADLADATMAFELHVMDASEPYEQVLRYRHASGRVVWIRSRGFAIRDSDGNPTHFLGTNQDITDLKEAELQLTENLQRLEHANEELQRFAYAASHDIRSPANTMASMLRLLAQKHSSALDDNAQTILKFALESAERMREMCARVLDYSAATHPRLVVQSIDLGETVQHVLSDLEVTIRDSAARVEHSIPDGSHVQGDPTLIRLAVQNLVENAMKYVDHDAPHVRIASVIGEAGNPSTWSLLVDDNGIGIPEAERTAVFASFKRLHLRTDYPGVGLGLATVKRVAQLHGGTVRIEDSPLGGSRFTMTLMPQPREDASALQRPADR